MKHFITTTLLFVCVFGSAAAFAQDAKPEDTEALREVMVEKAVAFLRKSQSPSGAFSPQSGIGPTTVILTGLMDASVKPDDPMVDAGLKFVLGSVQEDGGIYGQGSRFQNYETSLGVLCVATANKQLASADGKGPYDGVLEKAETYLRKCQYTDANGNVEKEIWRGGVGYGPGQQAARPDLSNMHFFLDAMDALGRGPDDPAVKEALIFVSRCQNLESEHNTLPFAAREPDGGFIYMIPDADAEGRQAGRAGQSGQSGQVGREAPSLRSYGSMTYAGLKSMIHAGVDRDDKRVKAAFEWVRNHYDLKSNPGQGANGLYYYYQVLAKSLDTMKVAEMEDKNGVKHDWRAELVRELAAKQHEDGSWVNAEAGRWLEGDANLVTGYVLMVLADCRK